MFDELRQSVYALVLVAYYNLKFGLIFCLYYVTHPFSDPWKPKVRLVPPEPLKNPKYGVHKYAKVNNMKLHYVESGDPSKDLMIFIHGFPEFWYSWRHQIVEFQKDYWVVAIDLRGYGDSEKPENVTDYKLPDVINDVKELINYLGREQCIMVGHDWGSSISWAFRRRYSQMLKALITMGGTNAETFYRLLWSNPEQFKRSWYVFFFQGYWLPEIAMRFKDMEIFNVMKSNTNGQHVTDEDIECYKYIYGKPGAFTPPLNYYRMNFNKINQVTMTGYTEVPSIIINGGEDVAIIPENCKVTKEIYKETEWRVVKHFRHFMQQENPDEVNAIIRTFLKEKNI